MKPSKGIEGTQDISLILSLAVTPPQEIEEKQILTPMPHSIYCVGGKKEKFVSSFFSQKFFVCSKFFIGEFSCVFIEMTEFYVKKFPKMKNKLLYAAAVFGTQKKQRRSP